MASNFLSIARDNRAQHINLWVIIKSDIAPWLASAGFVLLLFAGVAALIGGTRPDMSSSDTTANLYTWAQPFYFALVVLACFLARRSRDAWTWVLAGILIIFFVPQTETNLAVAILPNSIFQAIVAMIGFLAAGRLIEYLHMRYVVKLEEPTLSVAALSSYGLLVCSAIFFDAPLIFALLSN